jgi:hypothetical protein
VFGLCTLHLNYASTSRRPLDQQIVSSTSPVPTVYLWYCSFFLCCYTLSFPQHLVHSCNYLESYTMKSNLTVLTISAYCNKFTVLKSYVCFFPVYFTTELSPCDVCDLERHVYEDGCFLGCSAVYTGMSLSPFQRSAER